ncbi:AmiS/UreI family transporter [Aneurinibacillus sp. Ricciae_BoGa-3]|uniref:AmiS/UreI family transporter n=1 Tax=Aneurinibacillus sp. Ricciae_BoGa-3 TaxID=3022697 RepID=UPI002340C9F2|nr:AmiS/UreI family transporter [Aneurinibacillus sp. Ricciae_BoGa-3]WCK56575.1 AmiS/UreI family transporter [Aneurinibacillus sp. Ricciae_BoGa-3]
MGTVGLMYVGAVLFINGLMLLGRIDSAKRSVVDRHIVCHPCGHALLSYSNSVFL